jgi:ornithine cyclodeaminase
MREYDRTQIAEAIVKPELIAAVEKGFSRYSEGAVVVPAPGHLDFEDPPGNVHIKYGAVIGEETFTIKVACGFYNNPDLGIASSQGVVLVFSQKTGQLEAILFDEGLITDARTAAAGAVAAKYLAPEHVRAVGVIGTGTQARMQVQYLREVRDFTELYVLGRDRTHTQEYLREMEDLGLRARAVDDVETLVARADIIITATPSMMPHLFAEHARPGLHVTAVGADGPGKQEVEASFLAACDIVVVDSRAQCFVYGDTSYAVQTASVDPSKILELGQIIADPDRGRTSDEQLTFVDLTGVAVQDIVAAELILAKLREHVPLP